MRVWQVESEELIVCDSDLSQPTSTTSPFNWLKVLKIRGFESLEVCRFDSGSEARNRQTMGGF